MLSFCLFTDQYLYLILKENFYNLFMNVLKCHSGRLTMEENLSDFIKNIFICDLNINEGLTGLKRHGEQMMTTFVFL